MFWAFMNLWLSLIEAGSIWVSVYFFMRVNQRSIYQKKVLYPVCFFLAGAIQYGLFLVFPGGWPGVFVQFLLAGVLGYALFHRAFLPLVLDILFQGVLFLGMEGGMMLFNILCTQIRTTNYAMLGCLAMAIKIVLVAVLALMMVKWRKNPSEGELSVGQTLSMLALPAFSVFIIYAMIQMSTVYIQLRGVYLLLAAIVAVLLLNLYFLYLFRYLFRAKHLEQDMKLFQVHNQVQFRYYEELEKKYQESRKVLHDMKNHLQAVEQLYEEKNKDAGDAYVKDLYHMLNVLGERYYSSNHMLNIILNEKLSSARRAGIAVTAEIGDADFGDMKDLDITAIFANLLDNAVEAAKSAGENRFLEIKINTVQSFRVIQIRNSRGQDKTEAPGGQFFSGQTRNHQGLGLVNVRHTLEQYHGNMEQNISGTEYGVTIMIPGRE